MKNDPVVTNAQFYRVVMENERVRVLEYRDRPGDRTTPHQHPDSVRYTLSSFRRRLFTEGNETEVELQAGMTRWLSAQQHAGENVGASESHVIFVELKEQPSSGSDAGTASPLGPSVA
ncbi:MAG: cytoplasmic protein [Chloroflexota bacterium]|nr:cytoplasmic protein [Chloroflexota bacterium]